ncbi:MAG: hypothetical protein ABJN40_13175 [Sneathiella sp.]
MSWQEMTDNLATACQETFGGEVSYIPLGGVSFPVAGIFDAAQTVITGSGEVGVETVKPVLSVKKNDFERPGRTQPRRLDKIKIGTKSYEVVETEDDGAAEIALILKRV